MKKKLAIILTVILLMGSFTACGSGSSDAGGNSDATGEPITLTFGHGQSETHSYQKAAEFFKSEIEEKSGGQITVDIAANGSLGDEREMAEAMQLGSLDMSVAAVAVLSGFDNKLDIFNLPYLFESREQAFKVLDGDIGKEMFAGLEDQGIKVLGTFDLGFRSLTNSKREVKTPDDAKGLRIRTLESSICVNSLSKLGIDPVAMSFSELFTAMQTGAVDGQENPISVIDANRFYEVQKYLSLTEHFYPVLPMMISMQTWNKLSADQQALVEETAADTIAYQRQLNTDQMDEMLQDLKDNGMTVSEVDKSLFKEATKPVYEEYMPEYGDLITKIQSVK